MFMEVKPVMLPPGRFKLATRPISTGEGRRTCWSQAAERLKCQKQNRW
jgi:hypothetical protein